MVASPSAHPIAVADPSPGGKRLDLGVLGIHARRSSQQPPFPPSRRGDEVQSDKTAEGAGR